MEGRSSGERLKRLREVFEGASSLDPKKRSDFLDTECGNDRDLRAEVEKLLGSVGEEEKKFEKVAQALIRAPAEKLRQNPPSGPGKVLGDAAGSNEFPGCVIGPYELMEKVGQGGFGNVWKARQKTPVRRQVAVKILKLGMDSTEFIQRFDQERQALALMEHPNIAHVHDAGTTEQGRPFFVMEYVEGEPLVSFCRKNKLPLERRLLLFVRICSAIQHAHQKGIIHRDLKPSNILVYYQDGSNDREPVPKVIDFGVSKAISGNITEDPHYTVVGHFIGTPAYMSPEQAQLNRTDVDTRADIYSLGIILFELITGMLPFEEESFKEVGLAEIQRLLSEVEPPRPSTLLRIAQTSSTPKLSQSLNSLGIPFSALEKKLRSDLDWIVLKCLEKDRDRRYATAQELAQDVQRFLHKEPLLAGPPSRSYRLRKYVERNKTVVAMASMVLLSLLAGLIGTGIGFLRAREARVGEYRQRIQAQLRAEELQAVTEFQRSLFERLVPEQLGASFFNGIVQNYRHSLRTSDLSEEEQAARVEDLSRSLVRLNPADLARSTIDQVIMAESAKVISAQFSDQPQLNVSLKEALAQSYLEFGMPHQAKSLQEEAIRIRLACQSSADPDVIQAKIVLGRILVEARDLSGAKTELVALLGIVDQTSFQKPEIHYQLGLASYESGEWQEAEDQFDEAVRGFTELYGDSASQTLAAELEKVRALRHFYYDLGMKSTLVTSEMASVAEIQAPKFASLVSRIREEAPDNDSLNWRARMLWAESLALTTWKVQGEAENNSESLDLIDQVRQQLQWVAAEKSKKLGALHPSTMQTRKMIPFLFNANFQKNNDWRRMGMASLEEILEAELSIWGEQHANVVDSLSRLAKLQDECGLHDSSLQNSRRAIRILTELEPEPTIDLLDLYWSLSERLLYFRHEKEAYSTIVRCLELSEGMSVPMEKMNRYRRRYILSLSAIGELGQAEELIRQWGFNDMLRENLILQGRWEEAILLFEKAVERRQETHGTSRAYSFWWVFANIADSYFVRGILEKSAYWLKEASACLKMNRPGATTSFATSYMMAINLARIGEMEEALAYAHEYESHREDILANFPLVRWRSKDFPFNETNPYLAREGFLLKSAALWDRMGQSKKADQYLDEYWDFKDFLHSEADPELLEWYYQIVVGEYGFYSTWEGAPFLARRGFHEEAEWHFTRTQYDQVFRYNTDPELKKFCYRKVIDFYNEWNDVDPMGGHLEKARIWKDRLSGVEQQLAKWKQEESIYPEIPPVATGP